MKKFLKTILVLLLIFIGMIIFAQKYEDGKIESVADVKRFLPGEWTYKESSDIRVLGKLYASKTKFIFFKNGKYDIYNISYIDGVPIDDNVKYGDAKDEFKKSGFGTWVAFKQEATSTSPALYGFRTVAYFISSGSEVENLYRMDNNKTIAAQFDAKWSSMHWQLLRKIN